MSDKHWSCSDEAVMVKFTKVTREQRSGGNWCEESRVVRNSLNDGEKSMS